MCGRTERDPNLLADEMTPAQAAAWREFCEKALQEARREQPMESESRDIFGLGLGLGF